MHSLFQAASVFLVHFRLYIHAYVHSQIKHHINLLNQWFLKGNNDIKSKNELKNNMIKLSTNLICLIAKGITQLIFFTFFSRKGSQKITWYCFLGNWTKDITTGEKTCSLLSYIIWIYISRIYLHHVTKIFLSSAAPKSIIIKIMTSLWTSAKTSITFILVD